MQELDREFRERNSLQDWNVAESEEDLYLGNVLVEGCICVSVLCEMSENCTKF